MKLDSSKIEFSRNDEKRKVRLPPKLNHSLAHFIGIHLGDGHLRRCNTDYGMYYNGHFINEYAWYHNYLSKLIQSLFNIETKPKKGHNTIEILFRSKAVHSYLNKICGLPIGPKSNCDIPQIIKNSSYKIRKHFLLGLADTDFSLVFKNRHKDINYYPVIDFATSNKLIRDSIVDLLKSLGFSPYVNDRIGIRNNKHHKSYYFQINGIKAFEDWMRKIGFTNNNQLTKIEVWRKFGHLPPKTTIQDRIAFLKGSIDINSFYEKRKRP